MKKNSNEKVVTFIVNADLYNEYMKVVKGRKRWVMDYNQEIFIDAMKNEIEKFQKENRKK